MVLSHSRKISDTRAGVKKAKNNTNFNCWKFDFGNRTKYDVVTKRQRQLGKLPIIQLNSDRQQQPKAKKLS